MQDYYLLDRFLMPNDERTVASFNSLWIVRFCMGLDLVDASISQWIFPMLDNTPLAYMGMDIHICR